MSSMIFKSKLLREEIKHWIAILALFLWAVTATIVAISRTEKTILIGIDDAGTRIITNNSDRLIQSELKNFLSYFINHYYSYDEKTFIGQIGISTDLMSEDLWSRNREELLGLNQRLQKTPLTQVVEIESMDLIEPGKVEVLLALNVRSRLNTQIVKLKVLMEFKARERSDKNPWPFEITEVADAKI